MTPTETVRDLYRAMREKDDAAVYELCSADILWQQSEGFPSGSVWHGPASVIKNVFRANAKRWTVFAFTENEFIATVERVAVLGQYSGTSPTTGKSMKAAVAHVYDLTDGRSVAFACLQTRTPCGRLFGKPMLTKTRLV